MAMMQWRVGYVAAPAGRAKKRRKRRRWRPLSDDLDHVLSLYQALKTSEKVLFRGCEREWEDALDVHGERIDALHAELERLLAIRSGHEPKLPVAEHIKNAEKRWKKDVKAEIKREMADIIGNYLHNS